MGETEIEMPLNIVKLSTNGCPVKSTRARLAFLLQYSGYLIRLKADQPTPMQ